MGTGNRSDSRGDPVSGGSEMVAAISRRVAAPVGTLFALLADPSRHPDFDGSGMLRKSATSAVLTGVGDVFTMKMHHPELGEYEMTNVVVEFEQDRRITWESVPGRGHPAEHAWGHGERPGYQWGYELAPIASDATIVSVVFDCSRATAQMQSAVHGGKVWIRPMLESLALLDAIATRATSLSSGSRSSKPRSADPGQEPNVSRV